MKTAPSEAVAWDAGQVLDQQDWDTGRHILTYDEANGNKAFPSAGQISTPRCKDCSISTPSA